MIVMVILSSLLVTSNKSSIIFQNIQAAYLKYSKTRALNRDGTYAKENYSSNSSILITDYHRANS